LGFGQGSRRERKKVAVRFAQLKRANCPVLLRALLAPQYIVAKLMPRGVDSGVFVPEVLHDQRRPIDKPLPIGIRCVASPHDQHALTWRKPSAMI
jgi:hypothetical protein